MADSQGRTENRLRFGGGHQPALVGHAQDVRRRQTYMLSKSSIAITTAFVLAMLCLASPALAQTISDPVMGICTGWSWASGSTTCTVATPALDIGTSSNPNPTFQIAVNAGGTTADTMLIALVPNTSTSNLNFTASFNGSPASGLTTANWSSGTLFTLLNLTVATGTGNGGPNDYTINGGGGAALSGIQSVPGVTSYGVYAFAIGQSVLGPNATGGPANIAVSFSNFTSGSGAAVNGFPVGTIFLAVGLSSTGQITYTTPLTLGTEVVSTPEPGELPQLLLGLLFVGAFLGRRYF